MKIWHVLAILALIFAAIHLFGCRSAQEKRDADYRERYSNRYKVQP